jgi:hypothetical protein
MVNQPIRKDRIGIAPIDKQPADDEDQANMKRPEGVPDIRKPWIIGVISRAASLHSGVDGDYDQHPRHDAGNHLELEELRQSLRQPSALCVDGVGLVYRLPEHEECKGEATIQDGGARMNDVQ